MARMLVFIKAMLATIAHLVSVVRFTTTVAASARKGGEMRPSVNYDSLPLGRGGPDPHVRVVSSNSLVDRNFLGLLKSGSCIVPKSTRLEGLNVEFVVFREPGCLPYFL